MSNELAVVSDFTASLAPLNSQEFRSKDQTYVKIPAQGGTKWVWSDILGDYTEKELVGIAVVLTKPQHDLWPHTGQATEKTSPYLRSLDGKVAYKIGDDSGDLNVKEIEAARLDDGTYDCSKISYFQWQAGKDGRNIPPRASATSVIGILRAGDASPLFVRLSKTSSPVVHRFFNALQVKGVPHYGAVVSLGLEAVKGSVATYARVVPKFVSVVPSEVASLLKAEVTDKISHLLVGSIKPSTGKALDAVPF